jgi:hypothetical protein
MLATNIGAVMPFEDIPLFTWHDCEEIKDAQDSEFIAFVYDENNETVGVLIGLDIEAMQKDLRRNYHRYNDRYLIVQVVDNYTGKTCH